MMFRLLRADEIEVRVQSISKEDKGAVLLLYKDARCDMKILDETVGPLNWTRHHELIDGKLFCNVGIKAEKDKSREFGEWVFKQDVGTESYTEKEKGQASDAFKRACFNWGIGRELYTSPFVYVYNQGDINGGKCYTRFKVADISYNDNREIVGLRIVDDKGNERFSTKGTIAKSEPVAKSKPIDKPEPSGGNKCSDCDENITPAVETYSTKNYGKPLCMNCQKNYKK